jgi:hypothetical protein
MWRWIVQRHDLDVLALVGGLLFSGLGVLFALDAADSLDVQARWIWPILLIGLGIGGLVASRPRSS